MCKKLIYLVSFVLLLGVAMPGLGADDPNLMGWWTFDGHALDSSGNDRHGTINGDPQFTVGVFNEALEFDGDDSVTIDGYKGVLGPHAFSIAAWVKKTASGGATIVAWGQLVDGARAKFLVRNNGQLRLSTFSGRVQSDVNLSLDEWYHIAVTKVQDQDQATLYLDGQDVTSTAQSFTSLNIVADADVGIGWDPVNQGGYFTGIIDEVLIYDKVLTPEEIQQIIEGGGVEPYPFALGPEPADGALHENTWADLKWSPGDFALSHDVYLGDNFDDVNTGAENTFQGNQADTSLIVGFPGMPFPDGLVLGTTYYWRVDEVNDTEPNSPWKGEVWSFAIPPRSAYNTSPANGSKYVDPDVKLSWTPGLNAKLHHVYFGDNFDDVNSAVMGLSQSETTYNPGTLEFDKTYYWRVDEFDGAATHKGEVMSFSTMPVIDITDPNLIGWWKLDASVGAIAPDWSGHGNHGEIIGPQWLTPGWIGESALNFGSGRYVAIRNLVLNDPNGTEVTVSVWIRTSNSDMQTIASFDRSEYWRFEVNGNADPGEIGWSVNTSSGTVDLASQKLVDDGQWHHVAGVFDNGVMTIYIDGALDASVTGGSTFGTGTVRYGFIASQSEATVFDGDRSGSPGYWNGSLDDVRIYDKALTQADIAQVMRGDFLLAWDLQPSSGIYDVETVPSSLSWRPGDMAAEHDIYFGTDQQTVQSADASDTSGVYRGRQTGTTYVPPEGFAWDQTYYWRIDEFNTDGIVTKGGMRAIIVADFIGIDDFESYNDLNPDEPSSNRIFNVWSDGFDNPAINGSVIGYPDPPFTEQTIVHGGSQSMPYFYDNAVGNSEATLALTGLQDWTKHGIELLSLWFRGNPAGFTEDPAGIFTINASGTDIWDTADEFRYAYKQLSGAGSIVAQVLSIENTNGLAKAGVMIRESLDPGSKHAFVCVTPNNGVAAQARVTTGTTSVSNNQTGITAPHWVKLERDAAGTFTASHSADGLTWQPIEGDAPRLISMSPNVYIGLALTSHSAGVTCTAEFSNVQTTGTVTPMMWSNEAIGTTMLSNNPEPMYVALNDSAVVYHDNPNAAQITTWTEWTIDLQEFADQGVNLANVNTIAIGLGNKKNPVAGGSGTIYIDDIRLYRSAPPPESAPEPEPEPAP